MEAVWTPVPQLALNGVKFVKHTSHLSISDAVYDKSTLPVGFDSQTQQKPENFLWLFLPSKL